MFCNDARSSDPQPNPTASVCHQYAHVYAVVGLQDGRLDSWYCFYSTGSKWASFFIEATSRHFEKGTVMVIGRRCWQSGKCFAVLQNLTPLYLLSYPPKPDQKKLHLVEFARGELLQRCP